MKLRIVLPALLAAGLLFVAGASDASAFHFHRGCCASSCEPSCCAVETSCCDAAPCCDTGCCHKKHCRLFGWLHKCHKHNCCAPTCCEATCAAEPSCCAAPAAEPSCCAAPACDSCNTCCHKHHCRLFGWLHKCHRHSCCESSCCEASCGAEPSCCGN